MSEKRMVYAEDVIQRLRDLAPEILGGWYNPDMENELEQLVCVVESTPTAADSPHCDGSTNEDIAKELDALGANACSFRVGDCVMGMTVHSFKNLMSVAARALRGGADNAGKK